MDKFLLQQKLNEGYMAGLLFAEQAADKDAIAAERMRILTLPLAEVGPPVVTENRLLTAIERLGALLREPHHGLAAWTDSTLKCVREITDYLGIFLDAKQWHEFMNKVRNEAHLFPPQKGDTTCK